MGFFVRQKLEVLVGSAGWDEKVGPTTRPRGEALIRTWREGGDRERQRGRYTEVDDVGGRGWEMQRETQSHQHTETERRVPGKTTLVMHRIESQKFFRAGSRCHRCRRPSFCAAKTDRCAPFPSANSRKVGLATYLQVCPHPLPPLLFLQTGSLRLHLEQMPPLVLGIPSPLVLSRTFLQPASTLCRLVHIISPPPA